MIGSSDRLFARQDAVALAFSLGVALHDAMQVSFLINRQWAPFYKWRHRAFRFLPETPRQMEEFFERASTAESGLARIGALWKINDMLRQWLVDLGLAHSTRDELAVTADYLESRITDHAVRAAPPWDTLEQQRHWEWTTP
jgi:hypothetical protein